MSVNITALYLHHHGFKFGINSVGLTAKGNIVGKDNNLISYPLNDVRTKEWPNLNCTYIESHLTHLRDVMRVWNQNFQHFIVVTPTHYDIHRRVSLFNNCNNVMTRFISLGKTIRKDLLKKFEKNKSKLLINFKESFEISLITRTVIQTVSIENLPQSIVDGIENALLYHLIDIFEKQSRIKVKDLNRADYVSILSKLQEACSSTRENVKQNTTDEIKINDLYQENGLDYVLTLETLNKIENDYVQRLSSIIKKFISKANVSTKDIDEIITSIDIDEKIIRALEEYLPGVECQIIDLREKSLEAAIDEKLFSKLNIIGNPLNINSEKIIQIDPYYSSNVGFDLSQENYRASIILQDAIKVCDLGEIKSLIEADAAVNGEDQFIERWLKILKKLMDLTHDKVNVDIDNAIFAVSASMNSEQRQKIVIAANLIGIKTRAVLNNTNAAIYAYDLADKTEERIVMVIDIGRIELITTILKVCDDKIEPLATCPDSKVCGEELDQALINYCINNYKEKSGNSLINIRNDPAEVAIINLKTACQTARAELLNKPEYRINIKNFFRNDEIDLTVFKLPLTNMDYDFIKILLAVISNCIKMSKIDKGSLSDFVFTGECLHLLKIDDYLKEAYPSATVHSNLPPKEVVAIGLMKFVKKYNQNAPLSYENLINRPIERGETGLEDVVEG